MWQLFDKSLDAMSLENISQFLYRITKLISQSDKFSYNYQLSPKRVVQLAFKLQLIAKDTDTTSQARYFHQISLICYGLSAVQYQQDNSFEKLLKSVYLLFESSKYQNIRPFHVSLSFSGCKSIDCQTPGMKPLLYSLHRMLQECPEPFDAQSVGVICHGMHNMHCEIDIVRQILATLDGVINKMEESMEIQNISLAMTGFRLLNSTYPEVKQILRTFATQLSKVNGQMDPKSIVSASRGLVRMNVEHEEVQAIFNILNQHLEKADTPFQTGLVISAIHGLQNMNFDNPEITKFVCRLGKALNICSSTADSTQSLVNHDDISKLFVGLQGVSFVKHKDSASLLATFDQLALKSPRISFSCKQLYHILVCMATSENFQPAFCPFIVKMWQSSMLQHAQALVYQLCAGNGQISSDDLLYTWQVLEAAMLPNVQNALNITPAIKMQIEIDFLPAFRQLSASVLPIGLGARSEREHVQNILSTIYSIHEGQSLHVVKFHRCYGFECDVLITSKSNNSYKLNIELDGPTHDTRTMALRANIRDQVLQSHNITVLRLHYWQDWTTKYARVLQAMKDLLKKSDD
jgi:very-short-patch-repair endonuclease